MTTAHASLRDLQGRGNPLNFHRDRFASARHENRQEMSALLSEHQLHGLNLR